MGAALSYLACDSGHLPAIKEALSATDAGEAEAANLFVNVTPEDKLIVFESRRNWTFLREDERKRLSAGREVFFCMLEEHVMASEVACWNDGTEIWRVAHNSDEGIYHLDERGNLPPCYAKIKEARIKEQDDKGGEKCGVDFIFSIPNDLAAEFTLYEPDAGEPEGDYSEWCQPKPPGFLARLFGRMKGND